MTIDGQINVSHIVIGLALIGHKYSSVYGEKAQLSIWMSEFKDLQALPFAWCNGIRGI